MYFQYLLLHFSGAYAKKRLLPKGGGSGGSRPRPTKRSPYPTSVTSSHSRQVTFLNLQEITTCQFGNRQPLVKALRTLAHRQPARPGCSYGLGSRSRLSSSLPSDGLCACSSFCLGDAVPTFHLRVFLLVLRFSDSTSLC